MVTVVGLGNPGEEYTNTRHNTGRIILMMLAKRNDFSAWREDGKLKALTATGVIEKTKFTFILPNAFMNNSGKSLSPFVKSKKDLEKLVVVYDDLDLPIGRMKISINRSAGGHNGLGSIIKSVKSEGFARVRVGISPHTPSGKTKKPSGEKAVIDFLMKDFKDPELAELKKLSKKIEEALLVFSEDGINKTMSLYN